MWHRRHQTATVCESMPLSPRDDHEQTAGLDPHLPSETTVTDSIVEMTLPEREFIEILVPE